MAQREQQTQAEVEVEAVRVVRVVLVLQSLRIQVHSKELLAEQLPLMVLEHH